MERFEFNQEQINSIKKFYAVLPPDTWLYEFIGSPDLLNNIDLEMPFFRIAQDYYLFDKDYSFLLGLNEYVKIRADSLRKGLRIFSFILNYPALAWRNIKINIPSGLKGKKLEEAIDSKIKPLKFLTYASISPDVEILFYPEEDSDTQIEMTLHLLPGTRVSPLLLCSKASFLSEMEY